MGKISEYDAASPADGDFVLGLDVSDTSEGASGSAKRFPVASMFEARLAATPANVTGAGALWQVPFDTTQHAQAWASLNASTGAVTVSEAGLYHINAAVMTYAAGASVEATEVYIYKGGAKAFEGRDFSYVNKDYIEFRLSGWLYLSAGDVLDFRAVASGGTATLDVVNWFTHQFQIVRML